MIRASIKKRSKQLYKLKELQRERKDTRLLQRKIDTQSLVKPNAYRANIELDSRFFNLNQNSKHFDTFCRVYQLGNGLSFNLPIKHTKVSRKWLEKGKYKQAIRINEKNLVLIYEVPKELKKTGKTIGCDQGQNTVASFSDNQVTKCCTHNHDLNSIQDKLSRCKKGSKGFKRTQDHRKNYINHSLNQIDYSDIKELRLEKVKNIRRNKKSSRKLTHWKYPLIKQKLNRLGEEKGFLFVEVPNEFRSQRCSECGWVRKANRKGKTFTCTKCGFTTDSDLNASYNLELDLFEIPYWVRLKKMNRKGFYWNSDGLFLDSWECIVPNTKEGNGVE
jgi:transposase